MDSDDDIRVFLESPRTHELVSETDTKMSGRRRRSSRRKEKLPPYIPFRNVYEERDLSKLTERQRIMALKFQSASSHLSSLFLAVNDITQSSSSNSCQNECIRDAKRLQEFLEWLKNRVGEDSKAKRQAVARRLARLLSKARCICSSEDSLYKSVLSIINQ